MERPPFSPSARVGVRSLGVKLDLLAGRENARGVVGGSEAVTVVAGSVQLNVAAGSLAEDTAIALWSYEDYSPFIPTTNGITPLGEVTVDFASSRLNTSAALTFRNVAATPGDTLVVARVDRAAYDGIPRLQVVALADVISANDETNAVTRVDTGLPDLILEGVKKEGRYTLLRLAGPIGWITGSATASGSPVRALVATDTLPFVATSNTSGVYAIPAVPGPVTLTAKVLGQSLIGAAQTTAVEGAPVTVNLLLEGAVSQATITPASGAIGVEVNDLLTLTSPVALNPATVVPANISLRRVPPQGCAEPDLPASLNCAATPIPLRFVLSGSGKQLSIIPTRAVPTGAVPESDGGLPVEGSALAFSTTYTLEITGLLDAVGGLVTAPTTTFRTKDDVKPVYDLKALTFSFPDADGLVTVSAPNETLPPGTTILIINGGNGVVVSLTAGNDGQVSGTLPASISDQLFVTVTDPFGNTNTFTRSEFVGPDGTTGIGPGGGSVKGTCLTPATPERDATECAKSGIEIPDGALDQGLTLKAIVLTPEDYEAQHPNQRPDFGTLAQVIRLEASGATQFNKEADVTFAVPTLPAGVAPRDAFYYVLQRIDRGVKADGTPDYGFQVIDHAFVACPGETPGYPATPPAACDPGELRVKTASLPFPGLVAAGLIVVAGVLLVTAYAELLLIHAVSPLALGRSPKGVVSGTVRRQVWEGPENGPKKLVYKSVEGAEVSGFDTDGITPLMTKEGGQSVVTGKEGSFAFWDDSFSGGTVKVIVKTKTETKEVLAIESASPDLTGLRHYDRTATVNVTLDPEALPTAIPDVEVVLLKADGRSDLKGITLAGTPVLIAFKNNRKDTAFLIQGVEVGGAQFPVVSDPLGKYAWIQQPGTPFTPALPGTFTVETTALDSLGIPTPVRAAFRALAPGGNIDTDNNAAPEVMASRTTPKNKALGVAVNTLPSVAFTEPVTRIAGNVTLKVVTATSTEDVPIKISGITPQNAVIDDLGSNPTAVVTAITILPLAGLLFGTKYTLSLGAGIEDLDKDATNQPSPKNLTPYSTSFTTFGPETITPEATGDFGARGIHVFGQKAYVLRHQISGHVWNGVINRYDISDPASPRDEGVQGSLQGRPSHLVGEEASVAAVAGTSFKLLPSTAHLYGILGSGTLEENALISFANGGSEGNVERLVLKGDKLYAATFRKGLQVASLVEARQAYVPCCAGEQCCTAEHLQMQAASATDGEGFGGEAVIQTIPVPSASANGLAWFTGLAVTNGGDPMILATGDFGLAVAQEAGGLKWRGQPSFTGGGETLIAAYGLAVAAGLDGSTPLAYVVTSAHDGRNAILFVVNLQIPTSPVVVGATRLRAPRSVASILIRDGKAYIGYTEIADESSLTEIVSVENPSRPEYAGQIQGIGGHLAITEDGLLLGVAHSALGAKPLKGGVQAAALDVIPIISAPLVFGIGRDGTSLEVTSITAKVYANTVEENEAHLEIYRDEQLIEPVQPLTLTNNMATYEFAKGTAFDVNSLYEARVAVTPQGQSTRFSTKRALRPAQLRLIGSGGPVPSVPIPSAAEASEVVRLFSGAPALTFVVTGTTEALIGGGATVNFTGTVNSAIAPIAEVVVNETKVRVSQDGMDPGALGPFTGTFQGSVQVGPQSELVTAYAVDASRKVSSSSVAINPRFFDAIRDREIVPHAPLIPGDTAAGSYSFRVELKDRGSKASKSVVTIATPSGPRTVTLTKADNVFRSSAILAIPENATLPMSASTALQAARIPMRPGFTPTVTFGSVKTTPVVSGIEVRHASTGPSRFVEPTGAVAYRVTVGAEGTLGPTLSVSVTSLDGKMGQLTPPAQQTLTLHQESTDPRSPGYNLYSTNAVGDIVPRLRDLSVTASGVAQTTIAFGRLQFEAQGIGLRASVPVASGADTVRWETVKVAPINLPTGNGERAVSQWEVTQAAVFLRGTTPIPGLAVSGFIDKRARVADGDSDLQALEKNGEEFVETTFPRTTDAEGRIYFRLRAAALNDAASTQAYEGVVLALTDQVGIRAMAILDGQTAPVLAAATDLSSEHDKQLKTTPIVAGYASVGGIPRRTSIWAQRFMDLIVDQLIGPEGAETPFGLELRAELENSFTKRGISVLPAQLREYGKWMAAGFVLGLPVGGADALRDSIVGVYDLGVLGVNLFIPHTEEERVIFATFGVQGLLTAKTSIAIERIQQLNDQLNDPRTKALILAAVDYFTRDEILSGLTVAGISSVMKSYRGDLGKWVSYFGIDENSPGFRPLLFGFGVGALAAYFTESVVQVAGASAVGLVVGGGIGAALPVLLRGGTTAATAEKFVAGIARTARLINAEGDITKLGRGFAHLMKFLDALGPNAIQKWATRVLEVPEGPERILKLMIRFSDEPDGLLRVVNVGKGLSEDGARGLAAAENPVEALVAIEKIAADVNFRGSAERLLVVSAENAEAVSRVIGRAMELGANDPSLRAGFEGLFRSVDDLEEFLLMMNRADDDALRAAARLSTCVGR